MSKRYQNLEYYAQKFRSDNALSDNEPLKLKSLLQKNNIFTVYRPLSSGFSGMSFKIIVKEKCRRFMLINCEHSIGKQHFTICHELYHLYFQSDFNSEISCAGKFDKNGNPEEFNADMFASYLLLPRMGLWEMIPENEKNKNKISLPTLVSIEHYYACSRSALLNRLHQMDLIDENLKQNYSVDIKSNALKLGFSTDLYEKGNRNFFIGDYGTLAFKAWEEGMVSESSYLSLLEDLGIDISRISEQDSVDE